MEKRAAIFVGPEFGTVARPDLVAAAREAADSNFDVLIACAFNYDTHAPDFRRLGRVLILRARMNADLHMADDLKYTGKGNLFVVFGELEIGAPSYVGEDIIESPAWEWQHSLAEILGVLLDAGLRITSFDEHPVTMFRQFPGMVRGDDGLWRLPFDDDILPLIFTLTATR